MASGGKWFSFDAPLRSHSYGARRFASVHVAPLHSNNTAWRPRSVCDLYRRRWDIEVFFKQVKESLKLGSFLGHSANAVRWQVYTALLVYVLLRFMA